MKEKEYLVINVDQMHRYSHTVIAKSKKAARKQVERRTYGTVVSVKRINKPWTNQHYKRRRKSFYLECLEAMNPIHTNTKRQTIG